MKARTGFRPTRAGGAGRAFALMCVVATFAVVAALGGPWLIAALSSQQLGFDHAEHAGLFPSCGSCHAGAEQPGASLWPEVGGCASCHDGVVEELIDWVPPDEPPATNLDFSHFEHARTVADSIWAPVECGGCHSEAGEPWLSVHLAVASQCLDCHQIAAEHLAAPDEACVTCHVSLPEADRLTETQIAGFDAPPTHAEPAFIESIGHGATAESVSCTVCHAREFCVECHVDAPEQSSIQALASDPRSLAIEVALAAPPTHDDLSPYFMAKHGADAIQDAEGCVTCHTRDSCRTCHVATGQVAEGLYAAGPGRGAGAETVRKPPRSHDAFFRFAHGDPASAAAATCAGCHAREDCLECHRPDPAAGPPGFHTADWLSRHPVGAYGRESSCSDCHNPRGFCVTCHASAGIVARTGTIIGSGYHDAQTAFVLGHGQAARQSLESCVSCHAERDCLACHSATRGRRINPHGPDFNAERLRESAPSMCVACHGTSLPKG